MNFEINHILFPTDFSKNAQRALPYAAEIAHKTGAKLTLFHGSQDTMDLAPDFEGSREKTIEDSDRQFEEIISELRNNDKYKELNISTILQSGQPTTSLLNIVSEQNPDLVVLGTKGATGDRNVLFGSVTTSIIKKSETPVLAIPEGSSFDNFQRITFTTDYKEGDLSALKQTIGFAKLFKSTVDVLHISEQRNLESEIKFRGLRDLVRSHSGYDNIEFHHKYEGDFFPGAADYILDQPTSLLVMIRYKRSFWEKLTERSHSKEMAFYSKVPLLMLIGDEKVKGAEALNNFVKEGRKKA